MTYEELIGLMSEGDPVILPGYPPMLLQDGLFVPGVDNDVLYAVDLKVRIEGDKLRAWMREPKLTGDPRPWEFETVFDTYEDFRVWAYQW